MSSELRQKLIDRMNLYGLSKHTQKGYITAIKGLAEHYNKSPDKLTDDQVRDYFRHLLTVRKLEWQSCKNYLSGITYFYRHICNREVDVTVMVCRLVREGENCRLSSAWRKCLVYFPVLLISSIEF